MLDTSVYQKEYKVELRDVDFSKNLKLNSLFTYFQDAASGGAEMLGLGIDTLINDFSVTWILIRIKVDLIRNPKLNEKITIETWPQQPKSLEFERDFIVRDADGNIIIKAISSWVIVDINTHRLKKSSVIAINYPPIRTERAIDYPLKRLKTSNYLELVYKKVVGYSDVDFNGHLNNAKYIEFILDCYTVEDHKHYEVESIEVNFSNEALPGDHLLLYKDISNIDLNNIYIEGIKEEDKKTVFKAQVKIRPKV